MSIVSSGALHDALRQCRLLSREHLAEVPHLAHGRCRSARGLAKLLLQRGWLTIFQVNELLAGRPDQLVIGPYHLLDRLGKGGLSEVFKARHSVHGWIVALKVLRAEALSDEPGRRQFLREMEAMEQMDHPNVVEFCDVDQFGDTYYYAMEFVEGVDLGKQVALSGPLAVSEACECIRQTALGLQYAHEHNIIHRDIKPMNLFLTETVEAHPKPLVKIIDWGLAMRRRPAGEKADELPDEDKKIVGTADYLSPEQAEESWTVDIRSDLYSLGCTFYFLLTGRPPFPQPSLAQKLILHRTADPAPLSEFRQDVSVEVERVLRRLMAKRPQYRFQTPAAAALSLLPFVAGAAARPVVRNRPDGSAAGRNDTPLPAALEPAEAALLRKLRELREH